MKGPNMKQFLTIFTHELTKYFKDKVFLITTLVLTLLVVGGLFMPRIQATIKTNESSHSNEEQKTVILIKSDRKDLESLLPAFISSFPQKDVKITYDDTDKIKKQLKDQTVSSAFLVSSDLKSFTYLTNVALLEDPNIEIMNETLKRLYTSNYLQKHGLSASQIAGLQDLTINHQIENIDEGGSKNFWYAYIMTFVLYLVIMLFGQKVAMSVITEKTSRAMEVLITSAKPASLMFGKIMAAFTASLSQLLVIFGFAILSYQYNASYFEKNPLVGILFNIPGSLVVYAIIFFILGFLIYSFLFGAMGSTVSKVEDMSSALLLVQMIFAVGFVITSSAMNSTDINNPTMQFLSFFPLTSSMAMFTRIAMSEVPFIQILGSIIILLVSTGLIGIIAAKIYRVGVLLYGTKPNLRQIIKAIREN